MRTTLKAAIAAMALAGAAAAATPAAAQQFGLGIGPNGGISFSYDSGGYCDQWGCPDNFWDMPVYYGAVFFAGQWYDGPVYYRDWRGEREYWIHGQWRRDEWRGPRPGWWRAGRFGPPLGMDYYRTHNFHGRWDQDRRNDRGGNFGPGDNRGQNFGPRGDDRRGGFNGPRNNQPDQRGNFGNQGAPQTRPQQGDDRRGFNDPRNNQPDQRGNFGNQGAPQGRPQSNVAPAAAPAAANNAPRTFDPRRGRFQNLNPGAPAAAPAAAPPAAPPAAPADNGGRRGRGNRNGN